MAKRRKFKKGSKEAKAFMAKLRSLKHTAKRTAKKAARKVKRIIVTNDENLQPIIVKGAGTMAARKRRKSRKARRTYGGEFGGGRKRKTSRRRRYSGEPFIGRKRRRSRRYSGSIVGKATVMSAIKDVAGLSVGAVGSSFVANMIPIKNAKIKAFIPLLVGFALPLLPKIGRNPMMKSVAMGATAIGAISLIRQFAPGVPLLAGGETAETVAGAIDQLDGEERMLLGAMEEQAVMGDNYNGAIVETSAGYDGYEGEFDGALVEGASIGPENL